MLPIYRINQQQLETTIPLKHAIYLHKIPQKTPNFTGINMFFTFEYLKPKTKC